MSISFLGWSNPPKLCLLPSVRKRHADETKASRGKLLPGRIGPPQVSHLVTGRARLLLFSDGMSAASSRFAWLEKARTIPRRWVIVGVAVGIVLLIAYALAFLIDEPLRRYTEAKMNRALKGYTVHIKKLDFHPLGFSLDLEEVLVVQDAHPEPAVARIPLLSASVHWRALLHGRLVGDILIDHPVLHVNLAQAKEEIADPTPVKERG